MEHLPIIICNIMFPYLIYIELKRKDRKRDFYVDSSISIIVAFVAIYFFINKGKTNGQYFPPYLPGSGLEGFLHFIDPYLYVLLLLMGIAYLIICYRLSKNTPKDEEKNT